MTQPSPQSSSKTLTSPLKETPSPFVCHSHLPSPTPCQPLICFRLWTLHVNVILHHVAFCIWRLSLRMFSVFMLQHVSVLRAFLWLINIPLSGWATFCFILHPLMSISLPPFGPLSGNFIACLTSIWWHSSPLSPGETDSINAGVCFASVHIVCTSVSISWRVEWVL